jgi:hypothetical protein
MPARHPGDSAPKAAPSPRRQPEPRRVEPRRVEPRQAELRHGEPGQVGPDGADLVPYYAQDAERVAERRMIVRAVDAFGTHLICPRLACRREGRCADDDPRNLPFSARHYRGAIRFALTAAATARGLDTTGRAAKDARYSEVVPDEPWRGESLLAQLAARGVDISRMRRPADAGEDDWTWERDPAALARIAEIAATAAAKRRP